MLKLVENALKVKQPSIKPSKAKMRAKRPKKGNSGQSKGCVGSLKRYKSCQDMVESLSGGSEFPKQFKDHQSKRLLSQALFVLRNLKGMTQGQMAEKIGCTQRRVFRIESAEDADLRIKDVFDYLRPLL